MGDIAIQRGSTTLAASETSKAVTISTVPAVSSAFARILNVAASTASTATNQQEDHGATVEVTGTTTLTIRRTAGAATITVQWEVWSYEGAAGGAHEFKVLYQGETAMTGATATVTHTTTGATLTDIVPVLSGIRIGDGLSLANQSDRLLTRAQRDTTGQTQLARYDASTDIVVGCAVVEFTGSAWSVQEVTGTTSGSANTWALGSAVASWSNAFILASWLTDAGTGMDDTVMMFWPGSTSQIKSLVQVSSRTLEFAAYILENADLSVEHNNTVDGTAPTGDMTIDVPITAPTDWTAGTALVGYAAPTYIYSSPTRGFLDYALTSSTNWRFSHPASTGGYPPDLAIQVVDVAGLTGATVHTLTAAGTITITGSATARISHTHTLTAGGTITITGGATARISHTHTLAAAGTITITSEAVLRSLPARSKPRVELAFTADAFDDPRPARVDGVDGQTIGLPAAATVPTLTGIDVEITVGAADWLPGADVVVWTAGRLTSTDPGFVVGLGQGGRPWLGWVDSGGAAHRVRSTVSVPGTDDPTWRQQAWRVSLTLDNGAGGHDVMFTVDGTTLDSSTVAGVTSLGQGVDPSAWQAMMGRGGWGVAPSDPTAGLERFDLLTVKIFEGVAGPVAVQWDAATALAEPDTRVFAFDGQDDGPGIVDRSAAGNSIASPVGSPQFGVPGPDADRAPKAVRCPWGSYHSQTLGPADFDPTAAHVWSVRFRVTDISGSGTIIRFLDAEQYLQGGTGLLFYASGDVVFRTNSGGAAGYYTVGAGTADGLWHHLVAAYDGAGVARAWLDGEVSFNGPVAAPAAYTSYAAMVMSGWASAGGTMTIEWAEAQLAQGTVAPVWVAQILQRSPDGDVWSLDTPATSEWVDVTGDLWLGDDGREVLDITRGRTRPLEPADPATWTVRLLDTDRRFEPGNAASPYWPGIVPSRPVRVVETYDGVDYPIVRGLTKTFRPAVPTSGDRVVVDVPCVDLARLLAQTEIGDRIGAVMGRLTPDHWWKLTETAGATLTDSGFAATPVDLTVPASGVTLNGLKWGWGQGDPAVRFDGSAAIEIPTPPATLTPTGDMTVAVWARPEPDATIAETVRRVIGDDGAFLCALDVSPDSDWEAWHAIGGQGGQISDGHTDAKLGRDGAEILGRRIDLPSVPQRWHHIAWRREGRWWSCYVDGRQWGGRWQIAASPVAAGSVWIGGDTSTGGAGSGLSASLKILMASGFSDPLPSWAGERPIYDRLVADGHTVDVWATEGRTAAEAAAAAAGYDVVVLTSSSVPSDVGAIWRDVAVPLVSFEPFLADDNLTSTSTVGEASGHTTIDIVDASHPLAGGNPAGPVTVYSSAQKVSWVTPGGGGVKVASVSGDTSKATITGYEAGALLADGSTPAPARRAEIFPVYDSPAALTTTGMDLVVDAVEWAANVPAPSGGTAAGESFEGGMAHLAVWNRALPIDDIRQLAGTGLGDTLTAESTSQRVARLADWVGWPGDRRAIETGQETMPARALSGGETVLGLLRECALAEGPPAMVWVCGKGALRFTSRLTRTRIDPTLELVFADDEHGHPFSSLTRSDPEEMLRTRVTGIAAGGSGAEIMVRDPDGERLAGIRPLNLGTVQVVDDDTIRELVTAWWEHLAHPTPHVNGLAVSPLADPLTLHPLLLAIEVGDRVAVHRNPPDRSGTGAERVDVGHVDAIRDVIGREERWRVLTVLPASAAAGTIVGTSRVGVDTGPVFSGDAL